MAHEGDEVRERLARIETKLDIMITDFTARVGDHETRIRGLERWRYALPTSVILAIASVAVSVLHQ